MAFKNYRTMYDRYKIAEKIGEGNMGEIYRVFDLLKDHKELAMKIIKRSVNNKHQQYASKRFKQEFDIMSKLKHPNLIKVYDFGAISINDGLEINYFITMEYLRGQDLREFLIKNQKLEIGLALDIIVSLLRALSFIHSRNIVYRDLKQDNAFILLDGSKRYKSIKLLDFGISDIEKKIEKNKIKGTLQYMAPEVFCKDIDHRIDIFALGILFFEILTGTMFYKDSKASSIIEDLSNADKYNAYKYLVLDNIKDHKLRHIINKMTVYNKNDRYCSCSDIICDINNLLNKNYPLETPVTAIAYVLGVNFVDRDMEISFLQDQLNNNDTKLNIILGDTGSGKSRLFEEFRKRCQLSGIFFIETQITENSKPYELFIKIIRQLLIHSCPELIMKYGPELKRLLPNEEKLNDHTLKEIFDPKIEKGILINAIINFIIDFNDNRKRKLVIFIDDICLIDENSLSTMLELLFKTRNNKAIKLFAASRSRDEKIITILDILERNQMVNILNIKGFSIENIEVFIKTIFGNKEIDTKLLETITLFQNKVGGNPYFLQEFIRELIHKQFIVKQKHGWTLTGNMDDIGPMRDLKDIVENNLNKLCLDNTEQDALTVLALLAHPVGPDEFKLILNILPRQLYKINFQAFFNFLLENEVILLKDNRFSVANNLIKDVIQAGINDRNRSMLHFFIAEAYLKLYSKALNHGEQRKDGPYRKTMPGENELIETIAYHYSLTEFLSEELFKKDMILFLEKAGDIHKREYAVKKAMYYYDKALGLLNKFYSGLNDKIIEILHKKGEISNILGNWNESLAHYSEALKISLQYNIENKVMSSKKYLAEQLRSLNKYDEAIPWFNECLSYYTKHSQHYEKNEVMMKIGLLYYNKDEFEISATYLQRSLALAESNNYLDLISRSLNGLGLIDLAKNKLESAKNYFEKGLLYARSFARDKYLVLAGINNLGIVSRKLGDYDKALEYYNNLLKMTENYAYKQMIGIALGNMGAIYGQMGKYDKAMGLFKRAVRIYWELGDIKKLCIFKVNLGKCFKDIKEYANAERTFEEAIQKAQGLGNKYLLCSFYFSLSEVCFLMGNFDKSRQYNELSMNLSQEANRGDIIFFSKILKEKLRGLNDKESAIKELENLYNITTDEISRADVAYEIFNLIEKKGDTWIKYRNIALDILERAYKETPNKKYKDKIDALISVNTTKAGPLKYKDETWGRLY